MRKTVLIVVAAIVFVLVGGATACAVTGQAPATTEQVEPPRILLLGDSVTHGFEGEYTWRYFADRSIGDEVDFVGPHTGTWSAKDQFGGAYADPDFDTDHAARFGLSMFETLYYSSESAPSVPDLMQSAPEVLVLTLGFNDLVGVNQTPENTIDHARNIVAQARAANPSVDVVLFSLPQVWFDRVPVYNAMLPGLATELSTEASQVVVTPLAALENRVDTYDDSHPNTQGQEKIAGAVVASLDELGAIPALEPEPAPVVSPTVPPATTMPPVSVPAEVTPPSAEPATAAGSPRRVKVRRDGRRIVVKWRAGVGAERSQVRCGVVREETTRQRLVVRARARACKVRSVNTAGTSRWVRARVRR